MTICIKGQGATQLRSCTTYRPLLAQGATEYLVLLAVVLIIALVSIALLGFFPGMASDARITQSSAYWQSAKPFAIVEHSLTGTTARLVIRNNDATGSLTINNMTIGGTANNTVSTSFAPGETKLIITTVPSTTSGNIYDHNVTIRYTTSNNVLGTQSGAKTLVGKAV